MNYLIGTHCRRCNAPFFDLEKLECSYIHPDVRDYFCEHCLEEDRRMSEWKTLDELMEGKAPGEIRVNNKDYPAASWFQPYFKSYSDWYGLNELGYQKSHSGLEYHWRIWQEPKKKVMKYLWRYRDYKREWAIWNNYKTEDEAQKLFENKDRYEKMPLPGIEVEE